MSDMRDALRKAGLVSDRDLRQASHQERVRRKELGEDGLESERRRREEESRREEAERRAADRERERDRSREQGLRRQPPTAASRKPLAELLRGGGLLPREAGPRRFYFETREGEIRFLDVSDGLARRLTQGDAAIVDTRGILSGDFGAVAKDTAREVLGLAPERVLFWQTG